MGPAGFSQFSADTPDEWSIVMPSISPVVSRTLALMVCTLLFAGVWSNDRPVAAMAMKTGPIPRGIVEQEPEWVPVSAPLIASSAAPVPATPTAGTADLKVSRGSVSKSFRVESSSLLIAEEILQSHLNQLPLGLAVGDYRIVDSLGGVGWLHVRIEGAESANAGRSSLPRLLTTTVDDGEMQFIPVKETAISSSPPRTVR